MRGEEFRSGFVAVIGRPNVGKSTLINSIMGAKISIVTPKPQTTRHRILAIHTSATRQIVFVDTPGLHRGSGKAINRLMNRAAASALADADVVLFVVEATRWTAEDEHALGRLQNCPAPVIALLNKIDRVRPKERLLDALASMALRYEFADLIPISARTNDNLDVLMDVIERYLPESPALFPAEMLTDRSAEFHAAEIIREKLTTLLHEEVPYGLTVQIERYDSSRDRVTIDAIIWVERDSQKGIVIGKGGSVLKRVGRAARIELKEQLQVPVHLELWVKVKANWADREQELLRLGYETP